MTPRTCQNKVAMNPADHFAFVLVRPKSPGNMGTAARAIKNMGFSDLRFVAPASSDPGREIAMAVHADDLLREARTFPDLPSAVADHAIVVGTTAKTGPYRAAQPLRKAVAELIALGETNRVAIVFGPEDFGLINDDLKQCHRLITIPTAPEYASLNLAQAVMVVAYELRMAMSVASPARSAVEPFASASEVDAMLDRMTSALIAIGFLPEANPDHVMFTLRAMLGRAGLYPRDVEILNGIARQMRWVAEGGAETIAAKRRDGRPLR